MKRMYGKDFLAHLHTDKVLPRPDGGVRLQLGGFTVAVVPAHTKDNPVTRVFLPMTNIPKTRLKGLRSAPAGKRGTNVWIESEKDLNRVDELIRYVAEQKSATRRPAAVAA